MDSKKISVVMCTYNGEKYLSAQLDSILGQDYPIFEIIIQDDCSTDGTLEIASSYRSRFPGIKIYRNDTNIGFNANFRKAILRAEGDYIAISDQDDVWRSDKLALLAGNIGCNALCCSYYSESAAESVGGRVIKPETGIERLMFSNTIPGHTMLLRRDFVTGMEWSGCIYYDWWIAVSCALEDSIVCVPEVLSWHRKHEMSAIAQKNRKYLPAGAGKAHFYSPYIYGAGYLRHLKHEKNWIELYSFIESHSRTSHPLAHELASLLLGHGAGTLLHLCFLCMKYRKILYPGASQCTRHNPVHLLRGFFYPFIFAYRNVSFEK